MPVPDFAPLNPGYRFLLPRGTLLPLAVPH